MATVAPSSNGEDSLLDLHFLTEEERAKIEKVLREDEELKTMDRIRLGSLQQELERERNHQKLFKGKDQCACCEQSFGWIFNRGENCPECFHCVCQQCQHVPYQKPCFICSLCCEEPLCCIFNCWGTNSPCCFICTAFSKPNFICTVCFKKRLLDLQSVDSMVKLKDPPPLYGTELVLKSLGASSASGKWTPPSDEVPRTPPPSDEVPRTPPPSDEVHELPPSDEVPRTPPPSDEVPRTPPPSDEVPRMSPPSDEVPQTPPPSDEVPWTPPPSDEVPRPPPSDEVHELPPPDEVHEPPPSGASEEGPQPTPSISTIMVTEAVLLKYHDDATFGSTTSIDSDGGGKGDYDITGDVLVAVYFKDGHLVVHMKKAKGLAAADSSGHSDPYVKTYLLPDKSKHSKKKTTIKKKTLNPMWNESLKYKVPHGDLHSRTLWLSVWDWNRFSRNQFLGEVCLPLSQLDLNDTSPNWYSLQDKDESGEGHKDVFSRGELKLGMMFSPTETKKGKTIGTLTIVIKQARDLPNMDSKDLTYTFVKCYLLPDKSSHSKRKTGVMKSSLNPIWEERFSYEKVTVEELSRERVVEVTVWDLKKGDSNDFIGGLRLGPTPGHAPGHEETDSIGEEVSHWESMLSQPGKWVEQWHTLRSSMDPGDIDLSSCPPPDSDSRDSSEEVQPPVVDISLSGDRPQRGAMPVEISINPPTEHPLT